MIITANLFFGLVENPQQRYRTWDEWRTKFLLRYMLRHGVKESGVSDVPPLQAFVNHGKWLVRCENPSCTGAEKVWEEGLVMCCSCLNGHVAHQYLTTEFPANRMEIEEVLEFRAMDNRNWEPSETLADLQIENIEHDLEVA